MPRSAQRNMACPFASPGARRGRRLACGLALLAGLPGLGTGCGRAPSVEYRVSVPRESPGTLRVEIDLRGVPRDSLALRGFAAREVLRVSNLEATGPDGAALAVEAGQETVSINSRSVDLPRFTLRGPLPASLTVRYTTSPGNREGDNHMGFTGRCHGHVGDDFGFVTGRMLFLLPEPAEKVERIAVRFALPGGWMAAVPWKRDGEVWRPGVDGRLAAEHLVASAIGLGRFRERSFEAGATRYRLAFESGIAARDEQEAAARLEAVARHLRGLFGHDLGPEYLIVIVPKAPTRDELVGEGWATGQGQTLAPMTGNRLHQFADQLIEAYLRHAPYRSEIRRPEEFWLVDGLRNLYAWRVLATAGLVPEEALRRELAVGYLISLNVHGLQRDLERLYATPGSHRAERESLAPFVLAYLDHEIRAATGDGSSLDTVVATMFRGRRARSLWSTLPPSGSVSWEQFRERYVRGGADLVPVEQFYSVAPTRPAPEPAAGKPVRALTVVYTGRTNGYLENCGCKVNQSGGVARRATALERIRKSDPQAVLLDAGSAFLMPEKQQSLDYLSRAETSLYLKTMEMMRYQAVAVGATELTFGLDHFREALRGLAIPYLAANVRDGDGTVAPAATILKVAGLRIGVIGVFEAPWGRAATPIFEESSAPLRIDDPVETLRREVPALGKRTDLVFAIGRLTPATIRRAVEACPDLDLIVSTEYDSPTRGDGRGGDLHKEDDEGFVGRTLVAYTHLTNYGLGSVRLGLDLKGRIASADFTDHWLYEDVPDQRQVRDRLNNFYDDVGRRAAAQESVPPLFAADPERLNGRYSGAAQCATCHHAEHDQWMTTRHASAYKTLLDRHRHFQPKCVSCHVVGYGTPHGYRLGMPEQTLANVQCEVCHGPGAGHAKDPKTTNIRRQVPEAVCLECHNPGHSDHFVYAERLPKVRHDHVD